MVALGEETAVGVSVTVGKIVAVGLMVVDWFLGRVLPRFMPKRRAATVESIKTKIRVPLATVF